MNLKTFTDIAEILDIKRPNATKFINANLQVTLHEINGKQKKLIDIDTPKNKNAIHEYLEMNRGGIEYRGENFSRSLKKSQPKKQNVPRGTIVEELATQPRPKKEATTAKSVVSKISNVPIKKNTQQAEIIKTTSDADSDPNLPVERLILEFSEGLSSKNQKKYEKILGELQGLGIALIPEFEAQGVTAYTNLQAKRADAEVKRANKRKIEIQIAKEEGKTIPTDMASMAWSKYGDAAMTAFKQAAELVVNSFALENNIPNEDRSHYLNQLNESIFDGVEEQKKMGFQLIEQIVKDQTGITVEKKN